MGISLLNLIFCSYFTIQFLSFPPISHHFRFVFLGLPPSIFLPFISPDPTLHWLDLESSFSLASEESPAIPVPRTAPGRLLFSPRITLKQRIFFLLQTVLNCCGIFPTPTTEGLFQCSLFGRSSRLTILLQASFLRLSTEFSEFFSPGF